MRHRFALHALLAGLLVLPQPVAPATITVDGGDGDVAADGLCTLPEAIDNANDNAATHADCDAGEAGLDTISLTIDVLLSASHNGGSETGNGLPIIESEIAISGAGYEVTRSALAGDSFRLLTVENTGTLTLDNVTISGGHVASTTLESFGGGILNEGMLTLTHSTISGNTVDASSSPYPYGYGGGVLNLGSAYLYYSMISGNTVTSADYASSYAHVAGGGGIQNGDFFSGTMPTLVIENSTISGNSVLAGSNNTADSYGGGLYTASGTVTITNSTLSGNSSTSSAPTRAYAVGGGLQSTDADVTLTSVTISSNSVSATSATLADEGAAGVEFFPFAAGVLFTIEDSVLGNHGGQTTCAGITAAEDGGGNRADDASCGTIPSDLTGLDAQLLDNGGPTLTHALETGSNAIDNAGTCGLSVDQRGAPRNDGLCDSGAFEAEPPACSAPQGDEFVVTELVTDAEVTYEACSRIEVDSHMVNGPNGHLILRTAGVVEIGDDVEVLTDGRLTVEIDSTITMPQARAATRP